MVTLPPSLRILFLTKIRKLTPADLRRYDNFLALRLEYITQAQIDALPEEQPVPTGPSGGVDGKAPIKPRHELAVTPEEPSMRAEFIAAVQETSSQAAAVIRPYRDAIASIRNRWLARRRVAAQTGDLQQVPDTKSSWKNLLIAQAAEYKVNAQEALKQIDRQIITRFGKENKFLRAITIAIVVAILLGLLLMMMRIFAVVGDPSGKWPG